MIKPLTDYERKFVHWYVWEPLRRHEDYHISHAGLFLYDSNGKPIAYGLDPEAEDDFRTAWHLPYPIDPGCEFENIFAPEWVFADRYKPLLDNAAFFDHTYDPNHFIVKGSHLPLLINTLFSQNMIMNALKKELDDWWSKWKSFYGGKRQRTAPPIQVAEVVGQYQRVLVNLAAPRTKIENEVKNLLGNTGSESTLRHSFKKRESALKLWDLVDKHKLDVEEAAKVCKIPKSTAYDRLNEISQAIYGVSFIKSRCIRYRTAKSELPSPAPLPVIDRGLEIVLQAEYIKKNPDVAFHGPFLDLCKWNLTKPLSNERREGVKYGEDGMRRPRPSLGMFTALWRNRHIEDILIKIIDSAARECGLQKPTPLISELLRAESFSLLEDSKNLDK